MHYSCILESAQRLSRYNNHQSKELIFRYTEKIFEKIQKKVLTSKEESDIL